MVETHPAFGLAWRGWEGYRQFAKAVKDQQRYIRDQELNKFLEEIRASCHTRERTIARGERFWRAQIGYTEKTRVIMDGNIRVRVPDEQPYPPKRMTPIPNWQSDGRANPSGIPYLYLATDLDAARGEVRPWIGSTLSVAQFEIVADLKVIDCSLFHRNQDIAKILNPSLSRIDGIWLAIDQAFARPVTRTDEGQGEYIPTQIIAELFKIDGYDGITYKSLLAEDGRNLVLFNPKKAKLIPGSQALSKVEAVSYKFTDPYI